MIVDKQQKRLDIMVEDLELYFSNEGDARLIRFVTQNTMRYKELFTLAADQILLKLTPSRSM